jgi:hypothetical protein
MIEIYDGGGSAARLWCVEVVPKKRNLDMTDAKKVAKLAKGIPDDPDQALLWVAQVFSGFGDVRQAAFARHRQRLVVFRDKRRAAEFARKETNEFWTGKVREVRVV